MSDLKEQIQKDARSLLAMDENQLYMELGMMAEAEAEAPLRVKSGYGEFSVHLRAVGKGEDVSKAMAGNWLAAGRKFFDSVQRAAYALICSSDKVSAEDRQSLMDAFGIKGQEAFIVSLAGVLTTYAVCPAWAATIVATLLVRLIFKPAYDTLCEAWGESLGVDPA